MNGIIYNVKAAQKTIRGTVFLLKINHFRYQEHRSGCPFPAAWQPAATTGAR